MEKKKPREQHKLDVTGFFSIIRNNSHVHPALEMIFGVPNSVVGIPTKWAMIATVRLKKEGLNKGVPDICLPAMSHDGNWQILWIEHKTAKGRKYLSNEQKKFKSFVESHGHKFVVTYTLEELINAVNTYLNINLDYDPKLS